MQEPPRWIEVVIANAASLDIAGGKDVMKIRG